jgi:hypothetical protein
MPRDECSASRLTATTRAPRYFAGWRRTTFGRIDVRLIYKNITVEMLRDGTPSRSLAKFSK